MDKKMLCWPLFGTGMDELGKDKKVCEWEIPAPGKRQLLVRIDAIGLCFSDVKLIRAGEDHPRVMVDDLSKEPVIPGHEAVMTVVEAGEEIADKYPVGGRYIIQADIFYKGVNIAYGYAINGGMAQYSLIDERVLEGDEGSYLLELGDQVPSALAALIEPWTCVIASYMIEYRTEPKAGGRMLVAMEQGDDTEYTFSNSDFAKPGTVELLNVNTATKAALQSVFADAEFVDVTEATGAYDDLALCSLTKENGEALGKMAAKNAVINLVGNYADEAWSFDVGSIHYKGWFYQGTASTDIAASYNRNVRSKLRKGGSCWLVGGAGAMGQMHTQLAVSDPDGPAKVLVTDLDSERIDKMVALLEPVIKERGIEFKTLNPKDFESPEAFMVEVNKFCPGGYDDVVMLVPVPPVLSGAVEAMGTDCTMNIFAGIPAGKEATLQVGEIVKNGARYIGSSGSRTYHLQHTLDMVREGKLNTAPALAAIGGMHSLWEGINGVAEARFAGKTVILPNCPDMPLVSIDDIEELGEDVKSTIDGDGFYTADTEKVIFEKFSK